MPVAKNCVTEKTANRQRWIEEGLLELMLTKPFGALSVTDLCRHLELSRRSFYRYFDNLEDVLNSLLEHTFQIMPMVSSVPTVEDLKISCEFWVEHRRLLDALYNGGLIDKLFEFTQRYAGSYSSDLPELVSEQFRDRQMFIVGGFLSLTISWYMEGFPKTPEQMARVSHKMLYEPFLKAT